jgi:hypothetical protein
VKDGKSLYDRILEVTTDYLGPAAERFIDRQVQNHLQKQPAELQEEDLQKLIDWIRVAVSVLTDDSGLVREYTARLQELDTKKPSTS